MRHILYGKDASTASVAILIKESAFHADRIKSAYIDSIAANPSGFIVYSLWYDDNNKCQAELAKDHLKNVLHSVKSLGIKNILIADSNYFKFITKSKKAATNFIGYSCPSMIEDYENEFTIFYAPNYQASKHNPNTIIEMETALNYFKKFLVGNYIEPGKDIIHSAKYPRRLSEIKDALAFLLTKPELTVDVETKGLKFWKSGIATIAFAWDKHNFISIPVDRGFFELLDNHQPTTTFGTSVKLLLKHFFERYSGNLIAHNSNFDFKVLVYELWMANLQDYKGMIDGIQILTREFDDTKIIKYLATNNAVQNVLDLKSSAMEFAGNYGENVTNTERIPLDRLLLYNGKDCLATWFVFEKYFPVMINDHQERIYFDIFKPSVITLLQSELSGMPIYPDKVAKAKQILTDERNKQISFIQNSKLIQEYQLDVKSKKCIEFTEQAKKKVFALDDPRVERLVFNPGSDQQKGDLLYNYLSLPVLDLTDTNQPAVGVKTLEKLLHHTKNSTYLSIINSFIALSKVEKILSAFIPAFEENTVMQPDGTYRLYGNFNLGGTLSGRQSSSDPNLTNIPSNSFWAKTIKSCFGANGQWLFGGADFNSLEDMVSALITKDPNKLKVYIDGYNSHCLRAYYYFKDQMPDINESNVNSINSIETKYPDLRQLSKLPTFLLTYQGTYHGLMNSLGLGKEMAQQIENNYHELYKVSDEWVHNKLQQACVDGYVLGAFGLRLRTPLLQMNGKGKLNYQAASEGRTAGNMMGQSYGMLNSRAANEFRERVWQSKYKYDIFICCQIHDSIYIFWKNTAGITKWINDNLIECMQWCGLKELQHPQVKLGAELEIFYPDWASPVKIPNRASTRKIINICQLKENK